MIAAAALMGWTVSGQPMADWLASSPPAERVRAMLIRIIDRPRVTSHSPVVEVLAAYTGEDPAALWAGRHPRRAAAYAASCRARGDDPHADDLQAALVALMFCANCGRPLADPVSIDRGIGPDCWPQIDSAWRARIRARITQEPLPDTGGDA